MDMDTWVGTRLWDEGDPTLKEELARACEIADGELPILYSFIEPANWTLVTTRRICYSTEGRVGFLAVADVVTYDWGNFKGYGKQRVERMVICSRDGQTHYCPFETGKPSMGPIKAAKTLRQISSRKGA